MHKIVLFASLFFFISMNMTASAKSLRYGKLYCQHPDYYCVTVKKGQSWGSLFKNPRERNLVKKLNRMNTRLRAHSIIAVPKNMKNLSDKDIAPFPRKRDTGGNKLVVYDPKKLAWAAYDETGDLVRWGPGAGGKSYCPDVKRSCRTVSGTFSFYNKRGSACKSRKYPLGRGGAPMPYCMYFHGGYAFHGSPVVPGYHASHGCVRVFKEDARWLNREFINIPGTRGKAVGTKVIVKPYGKYSI